jgi:hypothetical protein
MNKRIKLIYHFIVTIIIFNIFISIELFAQDLQITQHPYSIVDCFGSDANIFINAESQSKKQILYQWFKDDEIINGAVLSSFQFPSLNHSQSGTYFCRVFNEDKTDSVDSRSASVYVIRPTSISNQPEDVITSINNEIITLNFEAHINGFGINEALQKGEFVNIQWFRKIDNSNTKLINSDIYIGANSSKLSIKTTHLPDTTYYFAEVEGLCGKVTTRTVKVIKNLNLLEIAITGLDACDGNFESLKAQIFNPQNHILEFKWYKDGKPIYYKENIEGIYSDELTFNPIYMNDAGKYKLEAKIQDINNYTFSNEVDVKVGKKPKIVCVRIDTLIGGKEYLNTGLKLESDSWLNIFYEKNSLPIQFDIYRDGQLISTKFSDSSVFSLGNINFLDYIYRNKDSSRFWVIAHNKCGYDFSDTISLYKQTICDPFNQFHDLCVYKPFSIYLDYSEREPISQLIYYWFKHHVNVGFFRVPVNTEYAKATKNKLELANLSTYGQRENKQTVTKYDTHYYVHRKIGTTTYIEDEFCCFYLTIGYVPKILKQPENKQINYGTIDTLVYFMFNNEFEKKIEVELYYMATLTNKPRLVDKSEPDYGRWFRYIRYSTFAEDGYYYAVARYINNCDPVITDTIKVTINPKGTTSIGDFESNSGLMITPNPASDYIEISIPDNSNHTLKGMVVNEQEKVQIFDILGIEMSSAGGGVNAVDGGGYRIDISNLPAGVYFVRIGDKVEKFLKI